VVASVTAQNSRGVQRVVPVAPEVLDAQLAALADDLRPVVIKTGLIGSVEGIAVLARWLDRLDTDGGPRVRLVIDPVLGASAGGVAFADAALIDAYRTHLLPRADLVTPNRREAARLLGVPEAVTLADVPAQAAALRALGAAAVCITGGDSVDGAGGADALDWLDTPHACGWMALPRLDVRHTHGTGCTFATTAAAAMARGFVVADALVLAKMATAAGLAAGHAAGQGVGPVGFDAGFASDARWLPRLSCDEVPVSAARVSALPWPSGLYAIVDGAGQAAPLLAAAEPVLCALQLRIKRVAHAALDDRTFAAEVCAQIGQTLAHAAALPAMARPLIVVNDHHAQVLDAIDAGMIDPAGIALHLGQEDVLALGANGRAQLAAAQARGLRLGVSSHSLWELCRAAALAPSCIACGPVWATTTKDMPWHPQGLHNLRWWAAMSPVPVVGIGGLLEPAQVEAVAGSGAACACLVRALATRPGEAQPVAHRLAAAVAAWHRGSASAREPVPHWPRPGLDPAAA
jgi:hydroxymethylpyrimidine kinase/phosphomethylpyrimidine kinase/thiamine-phosphate diphosphorylase